MSYALRPYLNFPGTTREAMEFYRSVFGGELVLNTFGDFHALPEGSPSLDKVMHSELRSEHITLAAADEIEETPFEVVYGNAVTLAIMGDADSEQELRAAFDRLAEGGQVMMALDKQVWGDIYGSLTDRFGTGWQFNITAA